MLMNALLVTFLLKQMYSLIDGLELGAFCMVNEDCSVENSRCHMGLCSCLPYYANYNSTTCLQSNLLGFQCHIPEQCSQKVANSTCFEGVCQCESGFLQFRRHTCLTPARVGQICYSDTHCQLWDSDTHCNFLIRNLFGKCVCNSKLGHRQNGTCVQSPSKTTPTPDQKPEASETFPATNAKPFDTLETFTPTYNRPSATETITFIASSTATNPTRGKPPKPTPTSLANRAPVKFQPPSKPSHKPAKRPSQTYKPHPFTPKPDPKPTENPDRVFQEKISTELEPPNSSPSTLKPFKTTITLVEKTKPVGKPNKPNKFTTLFFSPTALVPTKVLPTFPTNFPKFTVDVATTAGSVNKLTTWIINDLGGVLNTPTAPTRLKPTPETPTKPSSNIFSVRRPQKPAQYSTIKLNSSDQGLPAYGLPDLTSRWTTPAPVKDVLKTTSKPFKYATRVPGATYPKEPPNHFFVAPLKLKNQSKPSFGVTLVKPTRETPTTSAWIRPVTPGSSNIITKIIASPGPAALYNMGTKTGPEKDPLKVSLGMPCKNHKQCIRADPESRCMGGVCDCVKPRNNATGAYCNAYNRGCHPNTFQCKSSGKCISWFFVCDGRRDCPDGSDEACGGRGRSAGCPQLGFRCGKLEPAVCISQAARCDGAWDCPGGEDEANCTAGPQQDCPRHTYKCGSGQCVPEYEYCNAAVACKDGTDELSHACSASWDSDVTTLGFCPFRCDNGRCRSSAVTCSGKDGCGDDSDEAKCNVCRCAKIS